MFNYSCRNSLKFCRGFRGCFQKTGEYFFLTPEVSGCCLSCSGHPVFCFMSLRKTRRCDRASSSLPPANDIGAICSDFAGELRESRRWGRGVSTPPHYRHHQQQTKVVAICRAAETTEVHSCRHPNPRPT